MIPLKRTFAALGAFAVIQFAILSATSALSPVVAQQVVMQTVDGKQIQGTIAEIGESGRVTGTGIGDDLGIDSIVSIETGKPVADVTQRAHVYLAGTTAWGKAKIGADEVSIENEKVSLAGRLGKFQLAFANRQCDRLARLGDRPTIHR